MPKDRVKTHIVQPTVSTATQEEIEEALQVARNRKLYRTLKTLEAIEQRRCECCGELFMPARMWQKYCTDKCRLTKFQQVQENLWKELLEENNRLRQENKELKEKLRAADSN
jgi:hypothetical protein